MSCLCAVTPDHQVVEFKAMHKITRDCLSIETHSQPLSACIEDSVESIGSHHGFCSAARCH